MPASRDTIQSMGLWFRPEILRFERCRLVIMAARLAMEPVDGASGLQRLGHNSLARCGQSLWSAACWLSPALDMGCLAYGQAVVKAFRCRCLHNRAVNRVGMFKHARLLHNLHTSGGITFQIGSATATCITCPRCGLACALRHLLHPTAVASTVKLVPQPL